MNKLEGASAFKREVSSIPISKIKTNPYQPRKFFSENAIKELARSIREVVLHCVLRHPDMSLSPERED